MEAVKAILPIVISGSLMLLVLALGLSASVADATSLFRRPRQLLRAVVAIEVVVPLVAVLLVVALPLPRLAKLGILLMAVSPVPPLVPGKQLKLGGSRTYVCGLYVAVSLLAIVLVPAVLAFLSAIFPGDAWIPPAAIARTVLVSVLLPLAAGMAIRLWKPGIAERAAPMVSKLANVLLAVGFVPILIAVWPAMARLLGNGTALAIAAVVAAGLLAGHLLGGPDPDDRTTLAIAASTRHPGIALLIARTDLPGEPVAPAVLLFLLVGILAATPYQMWSKKRAAARLGTAAQH
jgi:bile acid:Na+ symporter, BASS family